MKKVALTTGGTGGHIFPALAVAVEIKKRFPDTELLFIGSEYGPEGKLAAKEGIPFKGLPTRGFLGRGLRSVPAAFAMLGAIGRALGILGSFRPDVVAGFGGYASFAPVLAAAILRIPVLLHEQNAITGASNRFLSRLAADVCVSLPETKGFNRKTIWTGNPVREDIVARGSDKRDFSHKRLFVLGGSQGAHALNEFIVSILPELKEAGVEILHQTGEKDLEKTRAAYLAAGYSEKDVQPFIDDMSAAYAWATLAFCRSGASTTAELCASGLPAVLVPFPAAIHDHQTLNAAALVGAGSAILMPEQNLDGASTAGQLCELLDNQTKLAEMSTAARTLAIPDAAAKIVDQLEKIAK